jgi:hypothetical protein
MTIDGWNVQGSWMTPITRYGFATLLALFGAYQLNDGQPVAALIAFVVAVAFVLFGRRG